MRTLFFWILPPFIGALIGYVTNALAIKMLFRPLAEIRLFGIRLPFTPGILPGERHKLADSIGRMVQRELLTPGVLRERLAGAELRENMRDGIGSYTETLLKRPLSSWLASPPDKGGIARNGGEMRPAAQFPLGDFARDIVNSEVFDSFLEEIIKTWAGKKNLSSGEDDGFFSWFKTRFRDIGALFLPAAKDMIKGGLVREMKSGAEGELSGCALALGKIAEKYPGLSLGECLSMTDRKKRQADDFLADRALYTLDKNLEAALSSVDIRLLVSQRINSLDMIRVEKIILDVMAGQLKWINIFGAVLGALIGFLEVLLSYFLR